MYKKILLATDGSEHAMNVLHSALETAVKWGAKLVILTVVPPSYRSRTREVSFLPGFKNDIEDYHRRILREAEELVKSNYPDLEFLTRLEKGRPSSIIVDVANQEKVDLIVMGSRGLGGIAGWVLGSTSRRVVETCENHILIIK